MTNKSNAKRPYFSHDLDARGDEKIKALLLYYRKAAKQMSREELESLAPLGTLGILWSIVEYAHRNGLNTDSIEILSDELRISEDLIKSIIEDFDFFRKEGNEYISDRIIRNLLEQKEKSKKNQVASNYRWALSNLEKVYKEIFDEKPMLTDSEKSIYVKHDLNISDFRKKLPDILYTVKHLRFENNKNFKPSINWLLASNHLETLLNGGYGQIKSWGEHKAKVKAAERAEKQKEAEEQIAKDVIINSETIVNKIDAIDYLVRSSKSLDFMEPDKKTLMKKFDITKKELQDYKDKHNV